MNVENCFKIIIMDYGELYKNIFKFVLRKKLELKKPLGFQKYHLLDNFQNFMKIIIIFL